ncbi:uncharacterized protein FIBRA_05061 [Fibroporia radiculosa]|uniref:UBP-type domain-containing protein n=1 Tax=Fibroporia radiculosa TaxID=599839 RepID=J4IAI0_9APHY|nr:uncharacterized protein FIBRA_05061 [Fibroporia radiculosa]CCM02946.1 predicted protein [Fibroporia radiculosa]
MRNYHIRISLKSQAVTPSSSASSYTAPSAVRAPTIFLPESLFQRFPSHAPRAIARRYTVVSHERKGGSLTTAECSDYRLGPIIIDWVDCVSEGMNASPNKKPGVGKEREREQPRRGEPVTATFVPQDSGASKSGSTNLPEGIVHIYRDVSKPSSTQSFTLKNATGPPQSDGSVSYSDADTNGLVLAVLAVPPWMTPSDFLSFVSPAAEGISLLRMIRLVHSDCDLLMLDTVLNKTFRDSAPNRSIVVMKFRTAQDTAEFAEAFNGKAYNSMEPEICHIVRVLSITIDSDDTASQTISFASDPSVIYELPTCPVCLERMDSAVTGLVTVPCSHTFHSTLITSSGVPTANLWICLICGNVGCGRYGRAHAHAHYTHTTHLYALELETQRVWDYAGDGYVHRLIQNKADGKLVELPSAASTVGVGDARGTGGDNIGPSTMDALSAEKIEAIGIEYSYLLTSQLDSQREFYEEQTTELRKELEQMQIFMEKQRIDFEKAQEAARAREEKWRKEERTRTAAMEAEVEKTRKRADKASELAQKLHKELQEERAVSKGLMDNLQKAKQLVEGADREKTQFAAQIRDLEDQVRDVMFFLEAKKTIESGEGDVAEAAGGSIELGSLPKQTTGGTRKSRSKRR